MILLAYDGSTDAQAAIDRTALLMPGAEAVVLTLWEPYLQVVTRMGSLGMGYGAFAGGEADEEMDRRSADAASATATEGAQRATDAGLDAHPRAELLGGGAAVTILQVATELDADLVALGTRGLGGVRSFLLGSVSHAVVQHADRPVLVVPSPALASQRRDAVHHAWSADEPVEASAGA